MPAAFELELQGAVLLGGHQRAQRLGQLRAFRQAQAQKPERVACQQFAGGVDHLQRPLVEDRDALAQLLRFLEVVRGQDHRRAGAVQLGHERPQRAPQFDVDAGSRLVEDHDLRAVHQRLRDQYPALHAAGQRPHRTACLAGKIETIEHLVDPRPDLAPATVVTGLNPEHVADRKEGIEHQLLGNDAQLAPRLPELADGVVAHDADPARVHLDQTGDDADESGFTGAVGTQQAKKLALADLEIDSAQSSDRAIGFADAGDLDGRLHRGGIIGAFAARQRPTAFERGGSGT